MRVALRTRAAPLAGLTAAAIIAVSAAPQRPPSQSAAPVTFANLFYQYRHGDADRAVEVLSTWTDRQIERDVRLPPDDNDSWAKAALALLLVEASWRIPAKDNAQRLIAAAADDARVTGDQRLLAFCRDWYFAGFTGGTGLQMDVEAEVGRRFADDALAQLELGKYAARRIRIQATDRDGFGYASSSTTNIVGTSSHGSYGEYAARAEQAFRRALALDPTMAEARVRLGRVLWFVDRGDEAEAELERAVREATAANAPALVYLADLFLGELNEDREQFADARAAYERAARALPSGQVARLALGRLLVATGRDAEGWSMTATALNPEAWARTAPDPWRTFELSESAWWSSSRFRALRVQVRER